MLVAGLVLVMGAGAAHAQSADDVVRVLTDETDNVGYEVSNYCRQTDEADQEIQIAVGAGFALAYQYFVTVGDRPNASAVTQITCTCESTPGEILNSFLATLGEIEDTACSAMWRADSADGSTRKFGFTPSGGAISSN